jgi:hypothetical protein
MLHVSGQSQSALSFTQIPYGNPDLIAPDRGAEHWGTTAWDDNYAPTIPAGNKVPMNYYTRFNWRDIESDNTQGSYSWTIFDAFAQQAIDDGAMFSFGIMPVCDGCGTAGTIPTYLHNLMQKESATPDWQYKSEGIWIPNWNSPSWQARWSALLQAVANHINTTTYKGVPLKNALYYVDVRGYGNWGEWHTYPWRTSTPSNAVATAASLKGIIDAVKAAFPNNQLVIAMGAFDTQNDSRVPAEVGYYALTTTNNFGQIGWRRDNLGDGGYNSWLTANPATYNGQKFSDLVMNKWKYAPIGGEPANGGNDKTGADASTSCGYPMCDLVNEVNLFHLSSFGNGNYGTASKSNAQMTAAIRAASLACGYRLVLTGGSMTTNLSSGSAFNITLNWQNIGVAPVYENWNVVYELRDASGKVVWTGTSAFTPKAFLPQGSPTAASDNFTLGSVSPGTYSMYLIVRDPVNYKKPLPLAITGRNSDGSYLLRSNITVGTGTGNQAPTANAGGDQAIQLPTSTTTLTGTGKDADGTIASYSWTKVSGPSGGTIASPASASTSITGLVQGIYVYTLAVTDNQGAIGTDTVRITVSSATGSNQSPVANAGSDIIITLPTNAAILNGSASADPDGSIASYAWSKISGPTQYSIGNTNTATTNVSNLVAGVYSFQLKVTDNAGATALDTVKVTVNSAAPNQPPVAHAGADITLTLPANVTNLNGSSSSDADGSITTYAWTRISGPTQYRIANAAAANTRLSNLVAGVYSFQLQVTDNAGATASDTVVVTVNAAPVTNQPPIANAGAGQTITLPKSSVTLDGSASADQDGTITAYAWSQVSGPSTAGIATPETASTTVSGLQQGIYVFKLLITDNSGATATDTVTVTVNAAANRAPVANAGSSSTITLPTNSVKLDGSLSSDPDGNITAYSWIQASGPSASTITGASAATATASNLVAGIYTFQLTVTDDNGATAKAQVKVTVVAPDVQTPVANAGADQTITLPRNTVTLDGSGSHAPSGSIVSYVWQESSGPSTVTLSNTAKNEISGLQAGRYVFYLTVTDNNDGKASDSVVITVNPAPNRAPVANAGANISMTLPNNSATLDGSQSYDPDGTISAYTWTMISGPNTPVTTGANTAKLSLSGLVAGQYTYQLTVKDNSGASASAQVKITVVLPPNVVPYANAGEDQAITAPASSVNLDGSDSYDPDGSITAYSWVKVSGPGSVTISNSNTATPAVFGLQTGSYVFELTVTDNRGATAKDQVTVIVNPKPVQPNQLPIANAGNNLTITAPASSIALNGTSSFDPDGSLTGYGWAQVSGPSTAVIANGKTATPTVSGLVVGQYVFELTVTDNSGATDKDQVTVTVNPLVPKANQAPIADAGADTTITLPVNTYVLDASHSSDPDGTIVSYQWLELSGPNTVASSTMDNTRVNIGDLQAGEYEFQVTVTDNQGVSSTAKVKLTVNAGAAIADQLLVYPNPAHDVIHGKITSEITGTTRISIYDMTGKLVLTDQVEKTGDVVEKSMGVDRFASGMYSIQINIANRKTMVTKFIKN